MKALFLIIIIITIQYYHRHSCPLLSYLILSYSFSFRNATLNCAEMQANGFWSDAACSDSLGFACQSTIDHLDWRVSTAKGINRSTISMSIYPSILSSPPSSFSFDPSIIVTITYTWDDTYFLLSISI